MPLLLFENWKKLLSKCLLTMFRNLHIFCVTVTTISGVFLLWLNFVYQPRLVEKDIYPWSRPDANFRKLILAWTTFFDIKFTDHRYLSACPELQCHITNDRKDLTQAEAVVFHSRNMDLSDLPEMRLSDQPFVFLSHEAPTYTFLNYNKLRNFFNWTMTYRMDSDIPYPYAYLIQTNLTSEQTAQIEEKTQKFLNSKSKSIVWFVSNCHTASKREQIAQLLGKFIQIDKFGSCGTRNRCPDKSDKRCVENVINKHYRFHLAFENTLCKDYITEKYWARWKFYSIPIVLRREIYQKYAPPNSFIAVDDYSSVKELAKDLKRLEKNRTEYLSYFQWRRLGYISSNEDELGHYFGFCRLCQRLWTDLTREKKSYSDLGKWWDEAANCDSGNFAQRYTTHQVKSHETTVPKSV